MSEDKQYAILPGVPSTKPITQEFCQTLSVTEYMLLGLKDDDLDRNRFFLEKFSWELAKYVQDNFKELPLNMSRQDPVQDEKQPWSIELFRIVFRGMFIDPAYLKCLEDIKSLALRSNVCGHVMERVSQYETIRRLCDPADKEETKNEV